MESRAAQVTEGTSSNTKNSGNVEQQHTDLMKDLMKQYIDKERENEELRRALGRKECLDTVRNLVPNAMVPQATQAAASESAQGQRGPPRRNDGGCFRCGGLDHWKQNCPNKNQWTRGPQGNQQQNRQKVW